MKRHHKLMGGAAMMAEYGDPSEPGVWNYLSAYSPYHHVKRDRKYPPVLFTTSTKDDRVHPGHARKMAAQLKELGHQVLFYENSEGGHRGAANSNQAAFVEAMTYTFLWNELRR
jgi:prolyl oligopeptidase